MSMERSNTNKSAEGSGEANYYVQKAFKGIKELTQAQKSMKGLQNEIKIRKLTEINKNLELASRKDPSSLALLRQNKVFIYIKHFFTENVTKTPALTFLRLLIPAQEDLFIYLNNNIPLLIARVLERDQGKQRGTDWEEQITEALKFIAEWINHNPLSFPRLLATSLVCFAELPAVTGFEQKKKDHISQQLKLLAIDILLSLTVHNLQLSLETGIFNLLLISIIDPVLHERSQDILIRILFFMNQQSTREKIWAYIDLKKLFSVFTDLDYVFFEQNSKNKGNIQFSSKLQTQLSLSKQALLTLLKSWNGIILLANDPSILQAVLESLKQIPKKQDSDIRKCIYSLLEQLLGIGQGLMSEGVIHQQNDFRASSLLSSYIIDLLRLLMNHGLFKLLIELSGIDQQSIAEPAQKLLKKLSIYIFNFLPDATKYMDFLISAGTKSGPGSSVLKYSSSFIVSKIGNYVFEDLKEVKNSFLSQLEYIFNPDSLFVPLNRISIMAVSKNLNYLAYKEIPNYRRRLLDLKPIPKEFKENFKKWDWNTIIDLLSFPDVQKEGSKADNSDKYKEFKLFKYLLRFYSPLRGNFIQQRWTTENLIYVKTGKLLIQNTLMIPDNLVLVKNPPQSQFQFTISFIGEIQKTLQTALENSSKNILKYYPPFFKTLQRQLILWVGSFTSTKIGYQSLICENNFFQMLQAHCKQKQCSFIIAGIMFYMDFYRESLGKRCKDDGFQRSRTIGPKALLIKAIKQGSKYLKLMSIEIIKLLYKGQLVGFLGEGFKLLLLLAIEESEQIWKNAIDTIQQLIKNKQLLQTLLSIIIEYEMHNKPGFQKLKEKISSNIYIRLTGIPEGYRFIQQKYPQWLEKEYQRWVKPESSQKYFDNLQQLLNNCLNFSKKQPTGYRIETKKKDWLQWAFLYKLPWILHINDSQEVPLLIRINNESVELYAEFDDEGYEFRCSNPENIIKICLAIGGVYLDHHMNPIKARHYTSINLNQNKLVSLYGVQYYCSSESGIQVYFTLKPRGESVQECSQSELYSNNYDIKRIHIDIKLSSVFQIEELPLHLIQEITKTEMGMQFLDKKGLTQHSKKVLINSKSSALQVRSVLWSLGYYGSTKDGIAKLIKQEIINIIINMSMNCPTLSMRGTCRYVLNMFCHSEEGRNCLARHGFTVSKKLLSCFPTDSNLLFKINDHPQKHISENEKFWSDFKKELVPMNQSQSKLFESISLLINSLSSKYAISQIKDMIKGGNKITFSYSLLQNIVHLMSYFKMKYQARKTIHFIFDQFLKSNQFINEGNGKIDFALG